MTTTKRTNRGKAGPNCPCAICRAFSGNQTAQASDHDRWMRDYWNTPTRHAAEKEAEQR